MTRFSSARALLLCLASVLVPAGGTLDGQVLQDGVFRFNKGFGCGLDRTDYALTSSFSMTSCVGSSFPASGTMAIEVQPETPELSGTLVPDAFLMQLVKPIVTKASASITATTVSDTSREPYSITLDIITFNSSNELDEPALTCRQQIRQDNLKAGTTVTLSGSNECRWTQLGLGFRSESGSVGFQRTKVEVTLRSKTGAYENRYGGEISTTYAFLPRRDTLVMFNEVPSRTQQTAGSSVAFSATARVMLRTRAEADLALRLYDADGNLQGTSAFVRVQKSFTELEHALQIPPVTLPETGALQLKAVLIDRSRERVIKEVKLEYPMFARCALEGQLRTEFAGDTYWMPDARVELIDTGTGAVVEAVQARQDPANRQAKSFFCFNPPSGLDPARQYRVQAKLFDALALQSSRFAIYDSHGAAQPAELRWQPFGVGSARGNRRDMVVRAGGDLTVADPLVSAAAAIIYSHMWRNVHRAWPALVPSKQLRGDLPVEVYLNAPNTSYYCPTLSPPLCPAASSINLQRPDSLPASHPHVVSHEFGHHVVRELYGIGLVADASFLDVDPYKRFANHGGYSNSFSGDSINEGFATFWAVASDRVLDGSAVTAFTVNNASTTSTVSPTHASIDIEQNWPAWSIRRSSEADPAQHAREELAVAGIFHDLIDAAAEVERAPDVTWGEAGTLQPWDTASIEAKDVIAMIAADIPNTLPSLRQTLVNRLPQALTSPSRNARQSGLSVLDEIFVMHRVFADGGDWKFQMGETIGKPAHAATWIGGDATAKPLTLGGRPWREIMPLLEKSRISLDFRDRSGNPVSVAQVRVALEFGGGMEHLNSSRLLQVESGSVYFEMPPAHYAVRAVITVPGSSSEPLVIENSTYWSLAGVAEHIAEKAFTLPSPVIGSLQPAVGAAGSTFVIQGSDFSAVAEDNVVRFGNGTARVIAATPTQLTVEVPAGLPAAGYAVAVTVAKRESNQTTFTVALRNVFVAEPELHFGVVTPGSAVDRTFNVQNSGGAAATVKSISVLPGFSVVAPATPFTVPAGGVVAVTVRFNASGSGDASSDILLSTDDPQRPEIVVFATASVIPAAAPAAAVTPAGVFFGAVAPGQSRTADVVVRNGGSAPLVLSAAGSSNGVFGVLSPALPVTIAPGVEQTLQVRFAPQANGIQTGVITLTTNDPSRAQIRLRLRGDGSAGGDEVLVIDDGTPERGTVGDGLLIVNRVTPARYPATLKTIRLLFQQFSGHPSPVGRTVTVIAFADPTGIGVPPANPGRLVSQPFVVPSLGNFVDVPIANGPTIQSGDFYVGFQAPAPAAGVIFSSDSTGVQRQRGWFSLDGGVTYQGPLIQIVNGVEVPLNPLIRAVVASGSTATPCTWGASPSELALGSNGAVEAVRVTTVSGCGWRASGSQPWTVVTSGRSGMSSATVGLFVDENASSSARTATVDVAGVPLLVTQEGGKRRAVRR